MDMKFIFIFPIILLIKNKVILLYYLLLALNLNIKICDYMYIIITLIIQKYKSMNKKYEQ